MNLNSQRGASLAYKTIPQLEEQTKGNDNTFFLSNDGLEENPLNTSKKMSLKTLIKIVNQPQDYNTEDIIVQFPAINIYYATDISLDDFVDATWLFVNWGFVKDPRTAEPRRGKASNWHRILLEDILLLPTSEPGVAATSSDCLMSGTPTRYIDHIASDTSVIFYIGRTTQQQVLLACNRNGFQTSMRIKYI